MTGLNRFMIIAVLAFPVLSFADAGAKEQSSAKNRVVQKTARKTCMVRFGGSAFPEPCDRVGEMPATAEPMHIIGTLPRSK